MRTERIFEDHGIRYRVLEEARVRYGPRPLRRTRSPLGASDPETLLPRLAPDRASMGERILREGARGWRYWSTVRRHAGAHFSPLVAETELLDQLVREAGLYVVDAHRNGTWMAQRFIVDASVREWLGIVDPLTVRRELEAELMHELPRSALAAGPPRGTSWPSFAFVLRCAERVLSMHEHGVRPGARELAGLVDHTKAWSPQRRSLLERVLARPFDELVWPRDRQLVVRGPIRHPDASLWASTIESVALQVDEHARGVLLVENIESVNELLPLAGEGWIVLQVPGGPPPAEVHLVARLNELAPELPFFPVFDLDPAGIRIASILQQLTGISMQPAAMTPELLDAAPTRLALTAWDRTELVRLEGHAGALEPLRHAIVRSGGKVEQETIQRVLGVVVRAAVGLTA